MAGRVPTSGRVEHYDGDEERDEQPGEDSPKKKKERNFLASSRSRLTSHLVETATEPTLGRPPRSEEEKRQCFQQLALLRSARYTYEQCAEQLGVAKSTISLWLSDPLYKETCETIQQNSRYQGFVSVGTVVQDAIATMYSLMQTDPSGFVRYKSAEYLLKIAGMEIPPQQAVVDDKSAVNTFLDQVRARALDESRMQVNVNINVTQPEGERDILEPVVDALPSQEITVGTTKISSLLPGDDYRTLLGQQQSMLSEYSEPLLPGGKLPGSLHPLEQLRQRQAATPSPEEED